MQFFPVRKDKGKALLGQTLRDFGKSFGTFILEQKSAALRVLIRRVVWDGEKVHVYLFGSDEGDIDLEDIPVGPPLPLGKDSK